MLIMKNNWLIGSVALGALVGLVWVGPERVAQAQPAKGAVAAFERVLEVMNSRFKDTKLAGDPDQDFATLVIAHHEDLIFLAKTQLEHGGDRQLRQLAERIADEQQKQISELKEWQVRSREAGYRAQPGQPAPGSGPLDPKVAQAPQAATGSAAALGAPANAAPSDLPLVSGTVEKVDAAAGKLTIDHAPIPNLNMDSMTMVFRVQHPSLLKGLKAGQKVEFQADRVNGQITATSIKSAGAAGRKPEPTPATAVAPVASQLPIVTGRVEKVDAGAGKVTIDHGPIPNLDMDAMTMVFRAPDAALLKGLKPGERIRFQADRVNGQISIMSVRKAR
jgi:Cu/Ag efflux protein CusF